MQIICVKNNLQSDTYNKLLGEIMMAWVTMGRVVCVCSNGTLYRCRRFQKQDFLLDHIRVLNEKYQGFDLECVRVC